MTDTLLPVILFTGFLGSGKTTTLKRVLNEHGHARKFGVIVNDLSELEVDGELIRLGDQVSEKNGTLASLNAGSIGDRGRGRGNFASALQGMLASGVEHIVIEASGATDPASVVEDIRHAEGMALRAVVAFADARALLHDYAGGIELLRRLAANEESGDVTVENLLARQLRTASVIALTKVDLLPQDELESVLRTLHVINPKATLTACVFGRIDPDLLFRAPVYQSLSEDYRQSLPPEEYEIESVVIRDVRPFHPERLHRHYREHLGIGIFRTKGFLWLASRPDDVLLWNQAGGTMGLEYLGTWRAAVLAHGNLLPEEAAELRRRLAGAHPLFGDRGNELTVIGKKRDLEIFSTGLRECFCTPGEVEAWRQGGGFSDPWPKTLKVIS